MATKKKKPVLKAVKTEKPENVIEFTPDNRDTVIDFLKEQIEFIRESDHSAVKAMMIVGYSNEDADDFTYTSYGMSLRDFLYSSELIKFNLLAENYNEN